MSIQPIHSDIKRRILEELDEAKFLVYACVAWFNDKDIFSRLVEKAYQGLIVELIIRDDSKEYYSINFHTQNGLDFSRLNEAGGKVYILPDNHNKYAVIDLKTVIAGSYNWTMGADFKRDGLESITISKDEYLASEQVALEFLKLKRHSSLLPWTERAKETHISRPANELTIFTPLTSVTEVDKNIYLCLFSDGAAVYCAREQAERNMLRKENNQLKISDGFKIVKRDGLFWIESIKTPSPICLDKIADDLPF